MRAAPTTRGSDLEGRIRFAIRDVPDFPKPGIVFKDITPLLADAVLFAATTDEMAKPFEDQRITHVIGIESRGFILGAPVSQRLRAGFIPMRKPGKLPSKIESEVYALEYGTDSLEVHADACEWVSRPRILIVDDVLATGGTADAACRLVERLGGEIVGLSFLLALGFLPGLERLRRRQLRALVTY
jgi:adenine phosphoribosyltransferase